ncbi:MAG: hypothetical protein JWO48_2989 [Bryobacterales bacterium]|nr:hypothetical protein [Bryobacterales bacterium]
MEPSAESVFLNVSIRKLDLFLSRIRECVDKLNNEQIWMRHGDHENAVGNLMLHLSGNVRQWIISGIGGQPDTRVRDQEFAARGDVDKSELMGRLEGTVTEALAILKDLAPERLIEIYQPQKTRVTMLEGIYSCVEHFAQHTAQIIFATKLLTGQEMGFFKHLNPPKP